MADRVALSVQASQEQQNNSVKHSETESLQLLQLHGNTTILKNRGSTVKSITTITTTVCGNQVSRSAKWTSIN